MKKIYLSAVGFTFLCRINAYAQTKHDSVFTRPVTSLYTPVDQKDTTVYNPRALHLDEVNLVSSYYTQNGDHSAITGGIGTEKVIDVSNGIDLHWVWVDDSGNKHTLLTGLGIDHHTSASSAFVTTTGLGKQGGTRIYPSLDWTKENTVKGSTFGIGAYYSGEYNYKSLGGDVHFSKKTNDKSGEFSAKLQGYFDHVTLIYPSEFIPTIVPVSTGATYITTASGNVVLSNGGSSTSKPSLPTKPRDTYTAAFYLMTYSTTPNADRDYLPGQLLFRSLCRL